MTHEFFIYLRKHDFITLQNAINSGDIVNRGFYDLKIMAVIEADLINGNHIYVAKINVLHDLNEYFFKKINGNFCTVQFRKKYDHLNNGNVVSLEHIKVHTAHSSTIIPSRLEI